MRPAWFPDWSGEVCAIVASGPSVTADDVAKLQGKCRVAVINNNHQLAPWADLLYAADLKWWDVYRGVPDFAGLKVIPVSKDDEQEIRAVTLAAKRYHLHLVKLLDSPKTEDDPTLHRFGFEDGTIGRGGNSAFQLINLVTQFRCKRQLWIGFDFQGEHWHEKHPTPLKNPRPNSLEKWRKRLDVNAPVLTGLGVEVVNCSAVSVLQAYERTTIDEALARWGV